MDTETPATSPQPPVPALTGWDAVWYAQHCPEAGQRGLNGLYRLPLEDREPRNLTIGISMVKGKPMPNPDTGSGTPGMLCNFLIRSLWGVGHLNNELSEHQRDMPAGQPSQTFIPALQRFTTHILERDSEGFPVLVVGLLSMEQLRALNETPDAKQEKQVAQGAREGLKKRLEEREQEKLGHRQRWQRANLVLAGVPEMRHPKNFELSEDTVLAAALAGHQLAMWDAWSEHHELPGEYVFTPEPEPYTLAMLEASYARKLALAGHDLQER